MSKYTPGPWSIDEYESGLAYGLAVPACAIMCRDNNKVVCEIPDYKVNPNDEADAHLIAAAPELLEALVDAIETAEFERHPFRAWHDSARAAIAKARGDA